MVPSICYVNHPHGNIDPPHPHGNVDPPHPHGNIKPQKMVSLYLKCRSTNTVKLIVNVSEYMNAQLPVSRMKHHIHENVGNV